jgi:hypothetical protein
MGEGWVGVMLAAAKSVVVRHPIRARELTECGRLDKVATEPA